MSNKLEKVYDALKDIKLFDILIYDFRDVSPYFDYQIIASASNERQAHSSIEFIKKAMPKEENYHIERDQFDRWILVDLGDIIVHVMHKETRNNYQIEKLFYDRKEVHLEDQSHGI